MSENAIDSVKATPEPAAEPKRNPGKKGKPAKKAARAKKTGGKPVAEARARYAATDGLWFAEYRVAVPGASSAAVPTKPRTGERKCDAESMTGIRQRAAI